MEILGYILTGIIAGLMSGLLGLGGGVVIVPALIGIFAWQGIATQSMMQLATGTSLAAMIFTTAYATYSHNKRQAVQWFLWKYLFPGTVIGGLIGVVAAHHMSTDNLRTVFAIFTFLLGLKMIWGANKVEDVEPTTKPVLMFAFAILVGLLSGLLGIGGGIVLIPFLIWMGLPMKNASATSLACVLPLVITGSVAAMITGWHGPNLPQWSVGYVYWPVALMIGLASFMGTPIGVALAHRLPVPIIKRIFGGVLWIIAWRMFPKFL